MVSIPNRQRLIERLSRLISFNSENPPGHEIEAIDYLADLLRGIGFDVVVDEFSLGRANVIARPRKRSGASLCLQFSRRRRACGWRMDFRSIQARKP